MHQIDMPIDYHVLGAILQHYQKYRSKLTNIIKLSDCFIDDMPQKCIDIKAIFVPF